MDFKPVTNIIDTIYYILIKTGQVFFTFDFEILEQHPATLR